MNDFGNRLRKLREQKKMTLRYLADRANLSYSFIASLEKGRYNPSCDTICALATALETDENELLILAGYLPNETVDQTLFLKEKQQPKELVLEKVMEQQVSFNGVILTGQEKNALLAFLQTMSILKK